MLIKPELVGIKSLDQAGLVTCYVSKVASLWVVSAMGNTRIIEFFDTEQEALDMMDRCNSEQDLIAYHNKLWNKSNE